MHSTPCTLHPAPCTLRHSHLSLSLSSSLFPLILASREFHLYLHSPPQPTSSQPTPFTSAFCLPPTEPPSLFAILVQPPILCFPSLSSTLPLLFGFSSNYSAVSFFSFFFPRKLEIFKLASCLSSCPLSFGVRLAPMSAFSSLKSEKQKSLLFQPRSSLFRQFSPSSGNVYSFLHLLCLFMSCITICLCIIIICSSISSDIVNCQSRESRWKSRNCARRYDPFARRIP